MTVESCTLCPKKCMALRLEDKGFGACNSGTAARIARAALHFWEEPPISGENGSGAVFFVGCPLHCIYCQNREISSGNGLGIKLDADGLSEIFFSLVDKGAHNINLVTPTHFIPEIRKALMIKKPPVPVVYNTSGYELKESLRLLEGLVDVYLPDFKYAEKELAARLSGIADYPETALEAISEMRRQQPQNLYENGLIKRGVIIRHMILPLHTENSKKALKLISESFPGTPVSLMAQYVPFGRALEEPDINRRITKRELLKVETYMQQLGIEGFSQELEAAVKDFVPDFHQYDEKRKEE